LGEPFPASRRSRSKVRHLHFAVHGNESISRSSQFASVSQYLNLAVVVAHSVKSSRINIVSLSSMSPLGTNMIEPTFKPIGRCLHF
jgi:hypothetical protein